jgi:hypothetical protein
MAAATVNQRMAAISRMFEFRAMRDPDLSGLVPKGAGRRRVMRAERGGLLGHLATARPSAACARSAGAGKLAGRRGEHGREP